MLLNRPTIRTGNYGGTPVGYYTLGRVVPRDQHREYVLPRRRFYGTAATGGGVTLTPAVLSAASSVPGTPVSVNRTVSITP